VYTNEDFGRNTNSDVQIISGVAKQRFNVARGRVTARNMGEKAEKKSSCKESKKRPNHEVPCKGKMRRGGGVMGSQKGRSSEVTTKGGGGKFAFEQSKKQDREKNYEMGRQVS